MTSTWMPVRCTCTWATSSAYPMCMPGHTLATGGMTGWAPRRLAAGDLNEDGCDDVAIGAPGYNEGGLLDTGRVYVFYGCQPTLSGLNDIPDWEFSIEQANANVGIDVSGAGDTNHDGYDDLLVGAHLFDDEQANEGTVLCLLRRPGWAGAPLPDWQVEGNKNDTYFGLCRGWRRRHQRRWICRCADRCADISRERGHQRGSFCVFWNATSNCLSFIICHLFASEPLEHLRGRLQHQECKL